MGSLQLWNVVSFEKCSVVTTRVPMMLIYCTQTQHSWAVSLCSSLIQCQVPGYKILLNLLGHQLFEIRGFCFRHEPSVKSCARIKCSLQLITYFMVILLGVKYSLFFFLRISSVTWLTSTLSHKGCCIF